MHKKRRQIIDIIKEKGSATVNDLRGELGVSGVTVRHHLNVLRSQGLVKDPQVRRQRLPGRPQYEYVLTPMSSDHFPKGYDSLAGHLMHEIKSRSSESQFAAVLDGVKSRLSEGAPRNNPKASTAQQVDNAVALLSIKGYVARREQSPQGHILHIGNCPYENLAHDHPELCQMDFNLVASMFEREPKCMGVIAQGASTCSYLISAK